MITTATTTSFAHLHTLAQLVCDAYLVELSIEIEPLGRWASARVDGLGGGATVDADGRASYNVSAVGLAGLGDSLAEVERRIGALRRFVDLAAVSAALASTDVEVAVSCPLASLGDDARDADDAVSQTVALAVSRGLDLSDGCAGASFLDLASEARDLRLEALEHRVAVLHLELHD